VPALARGRIAARGDSAIDLFVRDRVRDITELARCAGIRVVGRASAGLPMATSRE
jgi:hypothetical protein